MSHTFSMGGDPRTPDRTAQRAYDVVRVAFYVDGFELGGSQTSLATLIAALDAWVDATIVGPAPAVAKWVASARDGVRALPLAPVRSKYHLAAIYRHVTPIRELRPDVLHLNMSNPWTAQYGLLAGTLTRTPMVAVVHSLWAASSGSQHRLVRLLARRVGVFVGVSQYIARGTEALLGLGAGSARVGLLRDPTAGAGRDTASRTPGSRGRGAIAPGKGF